MSKRGTIAGIMVIVSVKSSSERARMDGEAYLFLFKIYLTRSL
jgi:hypothetical protein